MATRKNTGAATKSTPAAALHAPAAAVEGAKVEGAAAPATPNAGDAAMNFAAQQLAVPEAPAAPAAPAVALQDTPEFKAALAAALANRVPVAKKSAEPKEPRAKRVEQNGIKRPLAGPGICATMWATFDRITAEQGSPCTIAQAKVAMPTYNVVNMQGEYASWRKFNGIVGRIAAPVVVPAAPVQPAPAAEQEGTVADLGDSNIL